MNWKCHSIEKTQIKRKYVDVNQTGCPSGLRRQTQNIPQSRILGHECVRGFESHSCQKTFWTRRGRAFSWQILSYWNVNSRWWPKAKQNKDSQRHPWLIAEWFKNAQKERRHQPKTCETRKYTWVSTKIFSNGWHKPLSSLHLWIEKFTQLKKHRMYRKKSR